MAILPNCFAVHRERVFVEQTLFSQNANHRRQSARVIKIFHQVFARRHQVYKRRNISAQTIPIVERDIHADAPRERER